MTKVFKDGMAIVLSFFEKRLTKSRQQGSNDNSNLRVKTTTRQQAIRASSRREHKQVNRVPEMGWFIIMSAVTFLLLKLSTIERIHGSLLREERKLLNGRNLRASGFTVLLISLIMFVCQVMYHIFMILSVVPAVPFFHKNTVRKLLIQWFLLRYRKLDRRAL